MREGDSTTVFGYRLSAIGYAESLVTRHLSLITMACIGYILRSYPRLSQTFIVNEVWALEQLGLKLHIFAITDPREPIVQPQVAAVRAPVDYLDAATRRSKAAVLAEHLWA